MSEVLMLWLILEDAKGKKSEYAEYIDTLPRKSTSPYAVPSSGD